MASFHIEILRSGDSPGSHAAVFGLELAYCHAERVAGTSQVREQVRASLRLQADFLNALHDHGMGTVFALRFLSTPDPLAASAGTMRVVLLGKVAAKSESAARESASALAHQVHRLLGATTPGFVWNPLGSPQALQTVLAPFPIAKSHVAEICRREDLLDLDRLIPKPTLSHQKSADRKNPAGQDAAYVVHQFIPRSTTLERLFRTMLMHDQPLVLQVTLEPSALTDSERRTLGESIARVEEAVQGASHSAFAGGRQRFQRGRGGGLAASLLEMLMRLEDRAFLFQLLVASPAHLPSVVLNAVASELTYPVWSRLASSSVSPAAQMYGGGFDAVILKSKPDLTKARRAFSDLQVEPLGDSLAPAPLRRIRHLVDAAEAVCAFRFPVPTLDGMPGLAVRTARARPLPAELAAISERATSQPVGECVSYGVTRPVHWSEPDRQNHAYIVGQTGTGKTTLLRSMIAADMQRGAGMLVIDPHGDLFHDLLGLIPEDRIKDVVVLDPTDRDHVVGLNLLECAREEEMHFIAKEIGSIIQRLILDKHGPGAAEWMGPIFSTHMQMNLLLAMSNPADPGTLVEYHEIFNGGEFWKRWLPLQSSDPKLSRWVEQTLPKTDYLKRGTDNNISLGEWISTKFDDFVFDPRMRNIFGQKRSTINLRQIMDDGKILLVNLAKGQLTELNAHFLGMVLLAKLQAAAMSRADIPVDSRRPFYVYVDEFQSITTENFISLLSEGRKFGVRLVLANQFLSQISNPRIIQGVKGNVATHVAFRTGREDAEALEPVFLPAFDRLDLANLPNWHACARTTVAGQVTPPFLLRTIAPEENPSESIRQRVIEHSRRHHTRPRAAVTSKSSAATNGRRSVAAAIPSCVWPWGPIHRRSKGRSCSMLSANWPGNGAIWPNSPSKPTGPRNPRTTRASPLLKSGSPAPPSSALATASPKASPKSPMAPSPARKSPTCSSMSSRKPSLGTRSTTT